MVEFRALEESDLEAVCCLEQAAFGGGWDRETYRRELAGGSASRYWVLAREGRLLGFSGLWILGDEAHLNLIVVADEERGRGLGRYLLYRTVQSCRELGVRWFTLEVRIDNLAALRLYKQFGFARVGVRKAYYDGNTDAVLMWAGNLQSQIYSERLGRIGRVCDRLTDGGGC